MRAVQPQDLDDAVRELDFLQRLAQEAATAQKPGELVELVIRETTSAMAIDVCSLYLLDASGRQLQLAATNGLNPQMVGKAHLRVGEGITGWVAQHRSHLAVSDVSADLRFKWIPGVDQKRFKSMLSVPIEAGDRLVGVVNVQSSEERDFGEADVDFLRAIAGQVAGILERMELQRRLEAQLAEIRLSHEIHERFTQLSLDGAGIPAILAGVGALSGGRAGLYSVDGFRVRSGSEEGETLPARLALPAELSREHGPREVRIGAGRPPRELDVVPVRAGADLLGFLVVAVPEAGSTESEDGRLRALQHGSTVLALEMSKERAAAEVERRLRGDLVEELLAGGLDDAEAERLARQAERLGHRLPRKAWVIVLEPDDSESEAEMAARGRQDRIHSVLADLARRRLGGGLTLTRSSSAVLLLGDEVAPELATAERLAEQVHAAVAPLLRPGTASVGIGNLAESVAELARSHHEARQALRLARRGGMRGKITSYRSLGAFRLLLEVQSPDALRRFVGEVLGPLLKYAESRETPLLETLEALAAARWVRRAAARDLGIHVNSMSYRVERIESISGLKLDEPETRVAVAIALRARSMLGM
ncbi:MAG: GAF domain-containing protein [Chloroflexi bacterium]|nr:MAG: GAF domain-containing protein [Chloroflexota bacterium]TMD51511.1 MAG: GAF domain-containing protein [Chloroflexota bacterium]